MPRTKLLLLSLSVIAVMAIAGTAVYFHFFAPTRILLVNPLPAQSAEMRFCEPGDSIKLTCVAMEDASGFCSYDAVLMYGRGLFLDSLQMKDLRQAADKGVKIFTNSLRNFSFIENHNLTPGQTDTLDLYFKNHTKANCANLLRYIRHICTPTRIGNMDYDAPVPLPSDMYYHIEPGRYFETASALADYLVKSGLYNKDGKPVAFISGVSFPGEGNRRHVDTLISRITSAGYNVFPISAKGTVRERMIREVNPAAIVYLPMGRLGNDTLIDWCYTNSIPLFMPFPLIQEHSDWLDIDKPMSGGTLNARIVVPEIDGAMTPLCISTQDPDANGFMLYNPIPERIDAFMQQFTRFMNLRTKANADKRVAIGYFKTPGRDALLASGLEVIPSLYNFLKRLRSEGYNVDGLPSTLNAFKEQIMTQGWVAGDYAPAAQERFMDQGHPTWIPADTYEEWAKSMLLPEKYAEVTAQYGPAPGNQLARGDNIAFAAIRYGNILLFPQPRASLGTDDFKMIHGVDVPPPHSYLAPYLYISNEFDADALIHFGTHGNLEFTPGKNAGLSQADWAEVLIGNRPHFYFYTTGNVGEAIIAKRRSHAVLVTHLTPPYVESGQRNRYAALIDDIHAALEDGEANTPGLKREIVTLGIASDLGLDSLSASPYTVEELEEVDSYIEELAAEKITGAYYTLGQPYSQRDIACTVKAVAADKIAFNRARSDYDRGNITADQLHDLTFLRHHYLPAAEEAVANGLKGQGRLEEVEMVTGYRNLLLASTDNEFSAMIGLLSGKPVCPAPGGDPVANPEVLPTGRNMYSINAEATPGVKAWDDGKRLADQAIADYLSAHGDYPRRVSYSFWAGEFITSKGATIAQALRTLGVEPVRDGQGRVMDLRLTPSAELGRPRINIMVQVSGQLRDIAASRLQMLTDAVKLASQATDDIYPNYVAEGTLEQEKELVDKGITPLRARQLSTMRVFGPVNSGYGTGMLHYTEASGEWEERSELADGFVYNMCAMYGDTANWGVAEPAVMRSAVRGTDLIVQPRQSNTWGPVSLDHVYEFTGSLSLLATELNGKEPDAVMADYRNSNVARLQNASRAIAVETRATLLNPNFITERMKGDATTVQMFGEMFRNVFGWTVMRPSSLPADIYDRLYQVYVTDSEGLGIEEWFGRVNPAALQEMTGTMLEAVRKGYWTPDGKTIADVAALHQRVTRDHGAPCTEFVCGNLKLHDYIASHLSDADGADYKARINEAISSTADNMYMKKERTATLPDETTVTLRASAIIAVSTVMVLIIAAIIIRRRRNLKRQ